jgi:hypothetical protein
VPTFTTNGGGTAPPSQPDLEGVNPPGWVVPTAPFAPGVPTLTNTVLMPAVIGDPPVDIVVNNPLNLAPSFSPSNPTAEPSGAVSNAGVIFASANTIAAYSGNGGTTFNPVAPGAVFVSAPFVICCDQIVHYDPSNDNFIWLMQANGFVGYILAIASPTEIINHNGKNWHFWNLLLSTFHAAPGAGFDYPDLSVGDNYLYISWDVLCPSPAGSCVKGHQVARTTLAGLAARGPFIELDYTNPANSPQAWGAHLTQNTGDEIFWAGHNNNRQLRVFSWKEGSGTYFWRDREINSWPQNTPLISLTPPPDPGNWINFLFDPTVIPATKTTPAASSGGFPDNGVIGATRSANNLWFAWSAGTNETFPQPHIEMVELDRSNDFNFTQQVQITDRHVTFAYPALSTLGCDGEIGLSLESGGGGTFENHAVGFWGDFVLYTTTTSNLPDARFGDYVTIRQAPPTQENPGNLFAAFGYGFETTSEPGQGGFLVDIRYILFGRPATSCNASGNGNSP